MCTKLNKAIALLQFLHTHLLDIFHSFLFLSLSTINPWKTTPSLHTLTPANPHHTHAKLTLRIHCCGTISLTRTTKWSSCVAMVARSTLALMTIKTTPSLHTFFFFFFFFFLNLNFSLNLRRYNLTQCVSAVSAWVDTNRPDLAHIGKRKKKGHSTNARQRRRLRVTSLDAVRRPFCHVCASQMIICN